MATFFSSFFISIGILLIFSSPIFYLAWRKGRTKTIRRFLVGAGVIGLVTASVSATSEGLVAQCQAASNIECIDYGSAGIRLLFIVSYIIVSWVKAVILFGE